MAKEVRSPKNEDRPPSLPEPSRTVAAPASQPPRIKVKVNGNQVTLIVPYTRETELLRSLGTTRRDFLDGFVKQVATSLTKVGLSHETVDEGELAWAMSVVQAIKPRNEIEAMLGAQMAAIQIASMDTARRYSNAETFQGKDSAERALNKLARTYCAQLEALKRFRSKGEQRIRVERVDVHAGGQAIVGNVSHGGGGAEKREPTP